MFPSDRLDGLREQYDALLLAGWDLPVIITGIVTAITLLLFWTRLSTGVQLSSATGSKAPPSLPYWIPFLGHSLQYLYSVESALKEARDTFTAGIYTLVLGRERHTVVYSPVLIQKLADEYAVKPSSTQSIRRIARNVFGVPKNEASFYEGITTELELAINPCLKVSEMSQPEVDDIMRHLQANLPDLVTFNQSVVDEEPWERVSAVRLAEDGESADVSLLPLVFTFLTHMATDSMLTDDILSDSDNHPIAPLLLSFIHSYSLLSSGLSRMAPHPGLPSAHITRKQITRHLDSLLDVVEDTDLQGPLLAARQKVIAAHSAPANIRSSDLLKLLHGLNMPHVLTFWALLHIISDQSLLERLRKETSKYVEVTQEPPMLGFWVPPRTKIDARSLMAAKCPLLDSCLLETTRLYARGQVTKTVTEDFDLEGDASGIFTKLDKWKMQKGEWVDVPYWLANTDGANWEAPTKWDPERHLARPEAGKTDNEVFTQFGTFGNDAAAETTRLFSLAFISGVIALWDFEVDPKKSFPKPRYAAGVALPDADFRVKMRKRKIAEQAVKA